MGIPYPKNRVARAVMGRLAKIGTIAFFNNIFNVLPVFPGLFIEWGQALRCGGIEKSLFL